MVAAVGQIVMQPLFAAVIAGIALGIFNALLGGDGTFKQVFGGQFSFDIVKSRETLIVACALDNYSFSRDCRIIKRMHRLTKKQQNIVCNINHIVNCPRPQRGNSLCNEFRRGLNLHTFNESSNITTTALRIFYLDGTFLRWKFYLRGLGEF
jgi:hypothetical protein